MTPGVLRVYSYSLSIDDLVDSTKRLLLLYYNGEKQWNKLFFKYPFQIFAHQGSMPPQKPNLTQSPQFNNNPNQISKSISLKFMNHLLQIPQDYPIQFSIGKIKELVAFKKQHDCCHSSKNQLKNLKNQISLLRNQLNQNVNTFLVKQMKNDLNETAGTKPLQSKNLEKQHILSNSVQLNTKQDGYAFFRKQKFQQIQNQNPNISFKELNKMLFSKWLNLNSEDKQKYTSKHQELLKNRLNSQA